MHTFEADVRNDSWHKNILFLGNSFSRELAEAILCAMSDRVVAIETLAQTRADMLDNYVAASADIHKAPSACRLCFTRKQLFSQ